MQENDDNSEQDKQPIEMTSDELLQYSIAPEVAERLKTLVHDDDEDNDECD